MKTKEQKAVERGTELLVPVEATMNEIVTLEFPLAKFRAAATAKAWAKNHGFPVLGVTSHSGGFVVRCRDDEDFSPLPFRAAEIGKSEVVARVGELTEVAIARDLEAAAAAEAAASEPEPTPEPEPTNEVEFAKAGELFVISKAAGDEEVEGEEDAPEEVRMYGIVMKPDVPDSEGDVTSAEEIESANFGFMKDFQTVGFMHKKDVSEVVKIIQDVVAPVDFEFPLPSGETKAIAKGTWYQELWSDDPEIVKRVKVDGTLNGLSIGGFAKRVPITEMVGGELRVDVPETFSPAQKRAVQEAVAKAEGDPALAQFVDLRVEEVSLVDAAANEEDFFIIKRRREEMKTKKNEPAAADPKQEQPPKTNEEPTTKTEPESTPEPEAPPAEPPAEPTIAEQVADGIKAGVKAALEEVRASESSPEPTEETTEGDPPAPPQPIEKDSGNDAILAELKKIGERLDGVEAAQKDAGVARAVAKGQSAPEETATPAEEPEKPVSKWAGTAVHAAFNRTKR